MFKSFIKSRMGRFAKDTEGYITVEAIIVIPALLWLFGVGWVYFDAFRQQSVSQKANFTISDMISRETNGVDADYINNAQNLLSLLTKDDGSAVDLRVSVVSYSANDDRWSVEWSEARGQSALNNGSMGDYADRLPLIADGDQLLIVETWDAYNPVLQVGLNAFDITTYSFTRPRYAPQVAFTGQSGNGENNGFGNGDQDAPSNSLCNNNAENADSCS